ncbi:MAG: bifunctional tetrahydrofolate synthase/dihydrofolate synthase [Betaproteobacteria bacterium]|nr:MAG: bifunctional tetrahydrofolate synthase/dihydrofolate synthase [Betaproteobacteria bacterium]
MLATTRSLSDWLDRIERLHPTEIELGLERVAAVRDRLPIDPAFPLIVVGGTNGKGSTCAMLDAIYRSAGYNTALYTSPHLLAYNERVRINGRMVEDAELITAFERVEAARGDVALTYFEFGTLAAQSVFCDRGVDLAILEVGMGGRLDAVNIFEPACSLVVNVGIDHVDYLGNDREAIGFEKAGIFRSGRPAVCADDDPPASLISHASEIGADLYLIGRDFGYTRTDTAWKFWNCVGKKAGLPFPALRGERQLDNAAAALECVRMMQQALPVDMGALRNGLLDARAAARFQVLPTKPLTVLDVAHNAAAADSLSANLRQLPGSGRTLAVFGVLQDKEIDQIVSLLAPQIDGWYVCELPVSRAAPAEQVKRAVLRATDHELVAVFGDVASGLAAAQEAAREDDKIVVFGSFYTVSEALKSSEALRTLVGF